MRPTKYSRMTAERLLQQAAQQHQAGHLQKAEKLYRRLLAQWPEHADALHLYGVLLHQQGITDSAITHIRQAIVLTPNNALYHYNLAEAQRARGNHAAALDSYAQALALNPQLAEAHFNRGNVLLEKNALSEAIESLQQAVRLSPQDAEFHNNLANALVDARQPGAALHHYRMALSIASDYAEAHVNLGSLLESKGKLHDAIQHYQQAVQHSPHLEAGYIHLGRALLHNEEWVAAQDCFQQLTRLQPKSAEPLYYLGKIQERQGNWQAAINHFQQVLSLNADHMAAQSRLAECLDKAGQPAAALQTYEKALTLQPDNADIHFNMGTCLQNQGRFDEALRCHERALALRPDFADVYYSLAAFGRLAASDENISRLQRLLDNPNVSAETLTHLHFTLGKLHDEREAFDNAFFHYQSANRLKAAARPFNTAEHHAYICQLTETFDSRFFAERSTFGIHSELPIFIIGMPRSGTTLVEQILSSHPDVFGAGELDDIRLMVQHLPTVLQTDRPFPLCVPKLETTHATQLAEQYLQSLRCHDARATRIVDKMLGNFLRLGLIALLLPNARIIHCRRDPMDTCLSCYFQNFAHGLHFTNDLQHLGEVYRSYERLMAHWHNVLPLPIFEVQYETLIADQNAVSRDLLDFCGLAWDNHCLHFQETDRQVRTASFWQVRQPLYQSSVGRWHAYAKHLQPLQTALHE